MARYIYIVIHRNALKALFAGGEHELPVDVQDFLNGDLRQTAGRALPLSAAMFRCLDDVHGCPLEGHRRRLFLQSKAIEIICQMFEVFDHSEGFKIGRASCRERVCKSVWIPVGAVSLKKKNTSIT